MIRLNITVPVFNEEDCLARNIQVLAEFLKESLAIPFELVIAENGSTDRSPWVADELASSLDCVRALHLPVPGRGAALKRAWSSSKAEVLAYMDADLSSDVTALPLMVSAVGNGEADIVVGSRLICPGLTRRGFKRHCISRIYALLVRTAFRTRFSDPQCGFKVLSREACTKLLPLIEDDGWFFDTELLVIGEHLGLRILDLPVAWTERKNSHVRILATALADIKGLVRVRNQLHRVRVGPGHREEGARLTSKNR